VALKLTDEFEDEVCNEITGEFCFYDLDDLDFGESKLCVNLLLSGSMDHFM
jgi:hypothetical protein